MRIGVIGAGYVGLVAACCLARFENEVICIERDKTKINQLVKGIVPFYEEGLQQILVAALEKGRLKFSENLIDCIDAEVIMVAVGTPSHSDGRVDLSHIYQVMRDIKKYELRPRVLVMKSTVPPGQGEQLKKRFLADMVDTTYISNPEFLREGQAIKDWYYPDRIVLGGDCSIALDIVEKLYKDISAPVLRMDITSAEMVKYASNAYLATKISFINEIANLCELVGADITPVAKAVGMDHRIGKHFLKAGLGYGGSCFPKDTKGLDFLATLKGHTFNLLKAVIEVNARQCLVVVRKLCTSLGTLEGKRIGVLGLSFKPGTDDIRESPALDIIKVLLDEGAQLSAYDPMADVRKLEGFELCLDAISAASGCNAIIVATEWPEFVNLDWGTIHKKMSKPYLILDGRNCLNGHELTKLGFHYMGIGKS